MSAGLSSFAPWCRCTVGRGWRTHFSRRTHRCGEARALRREGHFSSRSETPLPVVSPIARLCHSTSFHSIDRFLQDSRRVVPARRRLGPYHPPPADSPQALASPFPYADEPGRPPTSAGASASIALASPPIYLFRSPIHGRCPPSRECASKKQNRRVAMDLSSFQRRHPTDNSSSVRFSGLCHSPGATPVLSCRRGAHRPRRCWCCRNIQVMSRSCAQGWVDNRWCRTRDCGSCLHLRDRTPVDCGNST